MSDDEAFAQAMAKHYSFKHHGFKNCDFKSCYFVQVCSAVLLEVALLLSAYGYTIAP